MEQLGIVEEITCDGRYIIRCTTVPEIGDLVFCKDEKLGTISRIFGPVNDPYVSVNPFKGVSANKGCMTFFKGRKHDGKGKRRNRRD